MSNDITIQGSNAITGNSLGLGSLSPEALMAYVSGQLNDMDSTIQDMMDRQMTNIGHKEIMTKARNIVSGFDPEEGKKKDFKEMTNALKDLGKELPPGHPLKKELKDMANDLREKYIKISHNARSGKEVHTLDKPSEAQWKAEINKIESRIEEFSNGSELMMMQIQTLMSQRQTAIQMTTNMLNKYEQGADAVARNIG